jgi:hypothetical protein
MLAATAVFVGLTVAARRAGWTATSEAFEGLSFPVPFVISMPFWLMKGQPWKAQAAIIGATLAILIAAGVVSTR